MIKSDSAFTSTSPDISHMVLLTYGTWLVVGGWLIFTGAELIYKTSNGDNSNFNYLLGVIRLLVGANALRTARSAARKSNEPGGSFIRLMAYVLFTIMVVMPLLLFIFQTSAILFGNYQPGDLYRANVIRLLSITICFALATFFADWRLRKHHLDVR